MSIGRRGVDRFAGRGVLTSPNFGVFTQTFALIPMVRDFKPSPRSCARVPLLRLGSAQRLYHPDDYRETCTCCGFKDWGATPGISAPKLYSLFLVHFLGKVKDQFFQEPCSLPFTALD